MRGIPFLKLKEECGLILSVIRICVLLSLALFLPRFFSVCKKNGSPADQEVSIECDKNA